MGTTVNGCDPSHCIEARGTTGYIPVYPAGNDRAHRICPGDPIAEEVPAGAAIAGDVTADTKRAVAASAFPWAGDAATTRAAFKADFLGVSNDAFYPDACADEQHPDIQFFKKGDLNTRQTKQIASPGAAFMKGDFVGPAEDPVTAGQLSDTHIEVCPEAEALWVVREGTNGAAVTRIEVEYV